MLVIHTKQRKKTGVLLNVMLKHLSEKEVCLKAFKVIRQVYELVSHLYIKHLHSMLDNKNMYPIHAILQFFWHYESRIH